MPPDPPPDPHQKEPDRTQEEEGEKEETHSQKTARVEPLRKKVYKCNVEGCGKAYTRPCRLKEHVRSHTQERPFQCEQCGAKYLRASHLARHAISHLPEDQVVYYTCPHPGCTKRYRQRQAMTEHAHIHTQPKPYVCDRPGCGEAFAKAIMLKRHASVHDGIRRHPCPADGCTIQCRTPSALRLHLQTHERSKSPKHLCGVAGCGKLFGLAKDLRTHIGKEHGWMCLTCDKVFHDAAKLRAHQITHKKENEPLVSCPIPGCSSSFVTSRSLRTHLSLTHHLGERLRRHQEQVHDKRKAEEGMMQETEDSEDQGKEGGVDRLTAISTTPSVSEPALPGARSSPRRSSGEQRPRAKMLIEILTGHDSPWSRPFRMTKRRRPTILDQAEEQMRQGKREDLLDKHKVQLLAVSFNPGHGEIDYTRTTYSSCSKNPDLYDCAFDRFDKQAQQFTVDKDQINFSILIITGSTRRCRYGLAKYITKILLCNLPP
ncbi:MAG: hypothetical protein DHS80DRAFT_33862 [Piptocephalis tieghemiana]|nr:MAG: hypothetical protein DHS80DRAFT_33862 [Piptocephalis tieghemiana]